MSTKTKFRVMTYNVHSCRGMDGKILPERIAKVIETYNPDLVALQELDVNCESSRCVDQPLVIAEYLRMHCHFQPAIAIDKEHYGIAIFSRYPFDIKRADHLPKHPGSFSRMPGIQILHEPRGAIWCSVMIEDKEIYFVNTHLGLRPNEQLLQVKELMNDSWLGIAKKEGKPIIVCGDFNSNSKSKPYKMLTEYFKDVKRSPELKKKKTYMTFFLPILEVDHIFFNDHVHLEHIQIPHNEATRIASDHLPIIADFTFK